MPPAVPAIREAVYDRDNSRVVITVEPCDGADCFSVTRNCHPQLAYGEWVRTLRFVKASGEAQTFYDYECPLNVEARYRVLSYAKRADGMLLAAKNYSAEVVVETYGWPRHG